jgi:aspartyl-tRNA synthetase
VSWRDLGAGELNRDLVGERRTLAGWVARRRDHGGLVFVDLRDSTGVGQLVVNPERSPEAAEVAHGIRNEFVLRAEGEIVARAPETVNEAMATGDVELQVDRLEHSLQCASRAHRDGADEELVVAALERTEERVALVINAGAGDRAAFLKALRIPQSGEED